MAVKAETQGGAFAGSLNEAVAPLAQGLSDLVFFPVSLFGAEAPLVVVFLVLGGVWFTLSFGAINLRGFRHAMQLVRGKFATGRGSGEVSHFQALATAVSGTVGIGNIGGVAVAISLGGPGASFWLIVAGLLGMTSKFVECTLGVIYRRENPDGSVSGGPMFYLRRGLAERGWPRLGRALGAFYATGIVVGCLGIGNMFQSNQAFAQLLAASGGESSWFAGKGWLVGIALAFCVGLVIVGGIRSIARVTEKIVPFMAILYLAGCAVMLVMNYEALPFAAQAIFSGAFSAGGIQGGALGVAVLGFQRAVFSNEAGIGSAAIAHSAVRTEWPATEGLVALLEPFIDTVVICSATSLVIVTTLYYEPDFFAAGLGGVEMTSAAFGRNLNWSPAMVTLAAMLFALSTMITWSYYGLKGWSYLVGEGRRRRLAFNAVFCCFTALGAMVHLRAILDFSDALIFLLCIPNLLGMILLQPAVRRELFRYRTAIWLRSPAGRGP